MEERDYISICTFCDKKHPDTPEEWMNDVGCCAPDGDGHLYRTYEISFFPGEPCHHKGCLAHISHACESCGRVGGKGFVLTWEDEYGHHEARWLDGEWLL